LLASPDSPTRGGLLEGVADFVSTYVHNKRNELRDQLRREFADRERALEARCAALERRLESVAQGRREKFAFAHERNGTVVDPSFSPSRKVVLKH
jgi:hypothetical protein